MSSDVNTVSLQEALDQLESDGKVIVFSKPACVQCNATYRALNKKALEYSIVDVSADEVALTHVLAMSYQQVPVVQTPNDHWSGYRPDKITALAALVNA